MCIYDKSDSINVILTTVKRAKYNTNTFSLENFARFELKNLTNAEKYFSQLNLSRS